MGATASRVRSCGLVRGPLEAWASGRNQRGRTISNSQTQAEHRKVNCRRTTHPQTTTREQLFAPGIPCTGTRCDRSFSGLGWASGRCNRTSCAKTADVRKHIWHHEPYSLHKHYTRAQTTCALKVCDSSGIGPRWRILRRRERRYQVFPLNISPRRCREFSRRSVQEFFRTLQLHFFVERTAPMATSATCNAYCL